MTATDLTGVRASSAVGCVRKAFYEGVEQEREELPRRTMRLFAIRSMQNDAVMAEKAAEARAMGREIVLEQEISWGPTTKEDPDGIWTGHADYTDWTHREVVESTGSSDLTPDRRKVLQVAFYAKRLSAITGKPWKAYVLVFDPGTGEERYVPVNWQALAFELDDLFATLYEALRVGVEPERVCTSPHDGPAMFCPFVGACFAGWEYPQAEVLTDDALVMLVGRIDALTTVAKATDVDKEVRPLKASVAPRLEPGRKYKAGDVEVKRVHVAGSDSISLKEIRDAGFDLPDELLPFVKHGKGHDRLYTERIERDDA